MIEPITTVTEYQARIRELESELDSMTNALAQAWDQLVPLLQEPPHETSSSKDIASLLEAIMAAVEAEMVAFYMAPRNDNEAEWFTIPYNVAALSDIATHLNTLQGHTEPVHIREVRNWLNMDTVWLLMPLYVNEQMVGAIGVGKHDTDAGFSALASRILMRMTERVASVLLAADLAESKAREEQLARELAIGGAIQRSILPADSPNMPGLQVAADWRPAASVSGDAWGWVHQSDSTVTFFMLDVAGKGIPAALAAVALHTTLTTMLQLGYGLVETVTWANKQMYEPYTDAEILATVAIMRINPRTGEVVQANAGHTPTLIRQDGVWSQWQATMPPLGVLPDFVPEPQSTTLKRGDLIVYYSDGLSEIETPDGLWGTQGLQEALTADNQVDAHGAVKAILEASTALRQNRYPHDDQTLLAISLTGALMNKSLILPADYAALDRLQPFVASLFEGQSERIIAEVHLALHELCTNVIRHGYAGENAPQAAIEMQAAQDSAGVSLTVRDYAPNAYEPPADITPPDPLAMPESGWGMYIIHQIMDEVRYTRHSSGNEWQLLKAF